MNEQDRKKFSHIEAILQSHGERLARIEEQNKNQYKMLKDIYKNLFGNGGEGLIQTAEKHKTYFKIMGAILSILAGTITGIIVKIIF